MQAVFLEIAIHPVSIIFDGANKRCSIVLRFISNILKGQIWSLKGNRLLILLDFCNIAASLKIHSN